MATRIGQRAIVIGAGMAGLAAACALADHFETVTVLERDNLPSAPVQRAGTPQGRHVHVLLGGGLRALAELLPGFEHDLRHAGAVPLKGGVDVRMERPGYDPFPVRDLGMMTYAVSRPGIEHALRQRLAHLTNVSVAPRCRVIEIVAGQDGAVAGVQCDNAGAMQMLPADLVVDASGRGTATLALLQALQRPQPKETAIGVDIGYATACYEIPADAPAGWKGVMTFPMAPHSARGAVLLPIEGGRWMLSLAGRGADKPPGDEAGFVEWAGQLRTSTIYQAIRHAKCVSDVTRFVFPQSVRRHYETLASFPRGVLPLGDAICTFNPVYGQGMSVAAQQAVLLRRLLAQAPEGSAALSGLAKAFFAELPALLDAPWATSAIPDFIFPETTGMRPPDLARTLRLGQALLRLAARKADVHKTMVEVQHLLKPRSVLRSPWLALRLMLEMRRG